MPKPVLWALDFGEDTVIAAAAEEKGPGEWNVLGLGEARARGVKHGEIEKLTDAVESVVEALRKAEKLSRRRCKRLHYTFDDSGMESAHPRGVRTLSGEGQITRSDIREAAQNAIRIVGDFQKTPVYSRHIHYIIDDKDSVANPVGVFGHRLDVVLHVLLARAAHLEQWKKLMRRAEIAQAVPVPSLVAAHYAAPEKDAARRIVWDLSRGLVSGGVVQKNSLLEYEVFPKGQLNWTEVGARIADSSQLWANPHEITEPVTLTEGLAGHLDTIQKKFEGSALRATAAVSSGSGSLCEPKYALTAGLLSVALEAQRRGRGAKTNKDLIGQVREKASAFIQEYF